MIGVPALVPIPRADPVPHGREFARYLREEYGATSTRWMLPPEVRSADGGSGLRRWLTALFRRPTADRRAARTSAVPHRTGVAAVHFAEGASHDLREFEDSHLPARWSNLPTTGLTLRILEADPSEESHECDS